MSKRAFLVLLPLLLFPASALGSGIAASKMLADGQAAQVLAAVITYSSPGTFFYVEDPDRSAGIRVERLGHNLAVGTIVTLHGTILTNEAGERYLANC